MRYTVTKSKGKYVASAGDHVIGKSYTSREKALEAIREYRNGKS